MEKIYHKYKNINGVDTLIIYVDYPDNYEFALDIEGFKKNVKKVSDKIREYALKNVGTVSNQTALLVLNGVVVGTLLLTKLSAPKTIEKTSVNNYEITENVESNNLAQEEKIYKVQTDETLSLKDENTTTESTTQNLNNNTTVKTISNPSTITTSVEQKNTQQTTQNKPVENTQTNSTTNETPTQNQEQNTQQNTNTNIITNTNDEQATTQPQPEAPSTPQVYEKTIRLKLKSGEIINIPLEEYIVGVVGAEMPAAFNIEALKAQAVVARTYALKKDASGKILSTTVSDQTYKTIDELKATWGGSFNTYYNKVKSAVDSTKGEYITYNGNYIDALYFSTSNGKTEDPKYVWGNEYAYLKPVDSSVDKNVSSYKYTKTFTLSDFCSKLGVNITNNSEINIISRTSGDRVNEINIGGKTFTGVKVRTLLALRSADFVIDISGSNVTITTYGFGHGCGMSQYGANQLAKSGYSYSQIIHHYYTGVQIQK